MNLYRLSQSGRKASSDISAARTEEMEVLLYLHGLDKNATADVDEISMGAGLPAKRTKRLLRSLSRQRLVEDITNGASTSMDFSNF